MADIIRAALAWRFKVVLDGLGTPLLFSGCSGLDAEYEPFEWKEGGNNTAVLHLPGQLSYTNVKLTRPVDKDSTALRAWFTGHALTPTRGDAVIELFDGNGEPVTSWTLSAAWPVKYTGPNLASAGEGAEAVAVESLELSHQGFAS
ncbi:MAG TPA: phage tail protein [Actinocrinis sp.]|uniref:phage tail protein n=1 Tax=Actinocrinis sp. TaxID=1920516 RepID=UPI002DDCAD2A|nr:phage tail protein [Actinocrinis sp.]HEV3170901.1 phage tail protein [Actinocrinis sp.]